MSCCVLHTSSMHKGRPTPTPLLQATPHRHTIIRTLHHALVIFSTWRILEEDMARTQHSLHLMQHP